MTRSKVDTGIYRVAGCSCVEQPRKHDVFDVVVSTGYDPVSGRYRQVWRRHHGTLTSARDARRDLLTDRRDGKLRPSARHTLDDLFAAWLQDLGRLNAAPQTVRGYRGDAARYWSNLGSRPLDRIARADVKQVTDTLIEAGTGIHHALSTISAAFSWAVQEGWIGAHQDPTKKIRRPSKPSRIPTVPTPVQVRDVLEHARTEGMGPWERFIFLGAVTGCRSGELRGLRARDVDLRSGVIGLVHAMSAEVEWTLKNRQERPVGLDEATVAVVEAQVGYLDDRAEAAGVEVRPDAFLFSDDPTCATHWRESHVSRLVATLFDHTRQPEGEPCYHRDGEPCPNPGPLAHFTFKHLRKFVATYGHELGFSTPQIAARLGHDPAVERRVYVGSIAAQDRLLSAGVAALLAGDE